MDKKLSEYYPWHVNSNLTNKFILCLDRNPSGGEFTFELLVSCCLQKECNVVLISFNHLRAHYEAILQKQAVNPAKLLNEKKFIIKEVGMNTFTDGVDALLATVMDSIASMSCSSSSVVLMIDDLLALDVILGCSRKARKFIVELQGMLFDRRIGGLIAYSKAYAESTCPMMTQPMDFNVDFPSGEGDCAAVNSSYGADSVGEGDIPLYAYCSYQADVTVAVAPLSTGFAMDVHGQISIVDAGDSAGAGGAAKNPFLANNLIYKALDTGVSCSSVSLDR